MTRCKKYIFLLILIFACKSVRANQIKDTKEALSTLWDGITGLRDIAKYFWSGVENSKILDRHQSSDEINSPIADFETDEKKQIRQQLKFLAAQGDALLIDIHAVKDVIKDKLVQNVAGLHDLSQRISEISTHIYKIDKTYDSFLEYVSAKTGTYDIELLSKFATDVVSAGSCGIKAHLVQMNALLIGQNARLYIKNLIDLILQHFEVFSQYTKLRQSQQQLFYNILAAVFWTEIKAYLIMHYAYHILSLHTKSKYNAHADLYDEEFIERNSNTLRAFKTVMQTASREYYKPDPVQHIEDVTYTQLKNVFQIIVLNAIDINKDDLCSNTCDSSVYQNRKDFVTSCFDKEEKLCKTQRPCKGDIVKCGYGFKNDMEICLPKDSTNQKRYEFLDDGDGVRVGPNKKCDGEVITASAKKYWATWYRRCDYCTCICAEKKDSDRFFSLHMSQSRYTENYVITGVRFVKKNHIVHIQAQEGQLLPGGTINSSTLGWIPLPEKVTDIFTIKWGDAFTIDLADLDYKFQKSHALIGVRLGNEISRKRLSLEITTIPIDYLSGQVLWETESLVTYHSPYNKVQFPSADFEIPTRFIEKNTQKTKDGLYGYFTISGKSDVGQSVIPFIDIQDIVTEPPAPLAGLGVYIRYIKNSGGFLALRLFTYDYEWHLNPNLVEDNL